MKNGLKGIITLIYFTSIILFASETNTTQIALKQLQCSHVVTVLPSVLQQANLEKSKKEIHSTIYKQLNDITIKNGIYHPQNINEVQSLINFAKANALQVRVMGAGHSASPAIFDQENIHEI